MFRPCIDLHEGKVKQIVGSSLRDDGEGLRTNFVSARDSRWYAELYKGDGLRGGHVVMLGGSEANLAAARAALAAYPGGLQVGGGIDGENGKDWLEAGASHVIVTSWLFQEGRLSRERLQALVRVLGRERLVLDLSCRRRDAGYVVMANRWQTFTDTVLSAGTLELLARSCAEFLVHAVDVEGLHAGIDADLVRLLSEWSPLPVTYAGGARSLADLEAVTAISSGKVDLTIGSALDIFGGDGVTYAEAVAFNRGREE